MKRLIMILVLTDNDLKQNSKEKAYLDMNLNDFKISYELKTSMDTIVFKANFHNNGYYVIKNRDNNKQDNQ